MLWECSRDEAFVPVKIPSTRRFSDRQTTKIWSIKDSAQRLSRCTNCTRKINVEGPKSGWKGFLAEAIGESGLCHA